MKKLKAVIKPNAVKSYRLTQESIKLKSPRITNQEDIVKIIVKRPELATKENFLKIIKYAKTLKNPEGYLLSKGLDGDRIFKKFDTLELIELKLNLKKLKINLSEVAKDFINSTNNEESLFISLFKKQYTLKEMVSALYRQTEASKIISALKHQKYEISETIDAFENEIMALRNPSYYRISFVKSLGIGGYSLKEILQGYSKNNKLDNELLYIVGQLAHIPKKNSPEQYTYGLKDIAVALRAFGKDCLFTADAMYQIVTDRTNGGSKRFYPKDLGINIIENSLSRAGYSEIDIEKTIIKLKNKLYSKTNQIY